MKKYEGMREKGKDGKHWFLGNQYEIFRHKVLEFERSYTKERFEIEKRAKIGDPEAVRILAEKYHAKILSSC